jgi:hypothetical protein
LAVLTDSFTPSDGCHVLGLSSGPASGELVVRMMLRGILIVWP